ncbi:hypothetical protein ACIA3K_01930 [Micromonospora sp. NPDC051543]
MTKLSKICGLGPVASCADDDLEVLPDLNLARLGTPADSTF